MTWFPDARTDEFYNQKYLNKVDKEFIAGYDWNTENVVDNFFNNLEDLDSDYLTNLLSEKVPDHLKEQYEMIFTNGGEPTTEERHVVTYADYLRVRLLDSIESERDQMITSMIDNMDDEEYKHIRTEVDGKPYEEE